MDRSPFVGQERQSIVDGLAAAFNHVATSRTPLWVSLEAPSGMGKTRVVHQFYSELARSRQADPPYWPPAITGDSPEFELDDVQVVRKQVNPSVRHEPGSLPVYLWWGLGASTRSGVRRFALETDVLTLRDHAPFVDDSWRRLASWSQRNRDWWAPLLALGREEAISEAFSQVWSVAVGTSVPGGGALIDLVKLAQQRRAESRARAERLVSDDVITESSSRVSDEIVSAIRRIASIGMPVVIFVEDLHAADEELVSVLVSLVEGDGSVLVVTTSWAGASLGNSSVQAALRSVDSRLFRVGQSLTQPFALFSDNASLAPLHESDAAAIVLARFPAANRDTVSQLVERYPNPLALELFCSTRRLRARFPDGRLELSAEELQAMPSTLQDLYRDLWRELSDETRLDLNLASWGTPAAISTHTSATRSWQQTLVRDAGRDLLARHGGGPGSGPQLRDWAETVGEGIWAFLEPAQLEVAAAETDYFSDGDRREFLLALANALKLAVRGKRHVSLPEALVPGTTGDGNVPDGAGRSGGLPCRADRLRAGRGERSRGVGGSGRAASALARERCCRVRVDGAKSGAGRAHLEPRAGACSTRSP